MNWSCHEAGPSYLVCFSLLGLIALAFSTRISLSGLDFSELYGDGTGRMTYRRALPPSEQLRLAARIIQGLIQAEVAVVDCHAGSSRVAEPTDAVIHRGLG
jgi:hypothetical protein